MPQYELNLRDYWQIIRKRQWVLVFIFFAVLIITIIYTHTQKPLYRATASVQWLERKSIGGMLTELVNAPTGDPLLTQAGIIKSRLILAKVVMELGLVDSDASEEQILEAADVLQGAVDTRVLQDTNIIVINVVYPDSQEAAAIANKIAKVYIAENIRERNKQNR